MCLFFRNIIFSFMWSKVTIWPQWKIVMRCKVGQIRFCGIGYPISVLIWEIAYPRGILLRIAFLCTSRFFLRVWFLNSAYFSNLLASATWLKVLLALGLWRCQTWQTVYVILLSQVWYSPATIRFNTKPRSLSVKTFKFYLQLMIYSWTCVWYWWVIISNKQKGYRKT